MVITEKQKLARRTRTCLPIGMEVADYHGAISFSHFEAVQQSKITGQAFIVNKITIPAFYFMAKLFLECPHVVHDIPDVVIGQPAFIFRHLFAPELGLVELLAVSFILVGGT